MRSVENANYDEIDNRRKKYSGNINMREKEMRIRNGVDKEMSPPAKMA